MKKLGLGVLAIGLLLGATATVTAQVNTDLCGSWCGRWVDCNSGHKGPLKGHFCKIDDTHYDVLFTGRFWGVFPFRYNVVLTVTKVEGDKVYLTGQTAAGGLFRSSYTYNAVVTGNCHFECDYDSCKYTGKFCMDRCCR